MPHINLLPWREELRRERQRLFINIVAGAAVLMLGIIALTHIQINGMIVEKSTQSLRQALAILCGQTLTDVSYDASGSTISEASGRPLAKA